MRTDMTPVRLQPASKAFRDFAPAAKRHTDFVANPLATGEALESSFQAR